VLTHDRESWECALLTGTQAPVDALLDSVGGQDVEDAGRRVLLRKEGVFVTVVGPERFIGDHFLGWSGVLTFRESEAFVLRTTWKLAHPSPILSSFGNMFRYHKSSLLIGAFRSLGTR